MKKHQEIKFYNSLTRKKDVFIPLKKEEISIYNCGITVYDRCHAGHGRSQMTADVLVRYLLHLGYKVSYVRNVTDIDDKILSRANKQCVSFEEITKESILHMQEDFASLNLIKPLSEPRVTHHIQDIILFIQELLEKGKAYINEKGDVYFSVNTFNDYGLLSCRRECQQKTMPTQFKQDERDFILWKKDYVNGWNSPWGQGRPGWHIECSALSYKILGSEFDIHLGGKDLLFPHHENEIAQSFSMCGKVPAKFWIHTGFLKNYDGTKMSKSRGDHVLLRDIINVYGANALRYYYLKHHYRKDMCFTIDGLQDSKTAIEKILCSVQKNYVSSQEQLDQISLADFCTYMNDDMATHKVIGLIHSLSRDVNAGHSRAVMTLKRILQVLGFEIPLLNSSSFDAIIRHLIQKRSYAKMQKQFVKADYYRSILKEKYGIILIDKADGTTEHYHTTISSTQCKK